MKANETPEKIYVHKSKYWGLMANEHNITKNDIEYTRTDAFIEKALAYLNEKFYFNNLHYAVENNTFNCMEEMFEDFEEYLKKCPTRNSYEEGLKDGRLIGYKDALHKINILEVKEVDLEKYYHEFLQKEWFENLHVRTVSEMMAFTAKHFFELGLKTQKGEKV